MPVHFSFTLFVVLATALFAQSDRGTITGTITDPAAAVVPNASVTAVNAENGSQSQTVTTATGHYALASLPAGVYDLTVQASGFKSFT